MCEPLNCTGAKKPTPQVGHKLQSGGHTANRNLHVPNTDLNSRAIAEHDPCATENVFTTRAHFAR